MINNFCLLSNKEVTSLQFSVHFALRSARQRHPTSPHLGKQLTCAFSTLWNVKATLPDRIVFKANSLPEIHSASSNNIIWILWKKVDPSYILAICSIWVEYFRLLRFYWINLREEGPVLFPTHQVVFESTWISKQQVLVIQDYGPTTLVSMATWVIDKCTIMKNDPFWMIQLNALTQR